MESGLSSSLSYETVEKVKKLVAELEPGMFVCELDRPWQDTPFVFQGFLLQDDDDILKVAEHCKYVFVDIARSVDIEQVRPEILAKRNITTFSTVTIDHKTEPPSIANKLGKIFRRRKKVITFKEALKPAVENRRHTSVLVKSMMNEIRLGKSIDTPAAKEAVAACVDSVMTNMDANLLLTRLRHKDEYTSEHSLNVAIISIAFGRHMGMDRKQLNEIGMCGLLHDMGKMLTPLEVLNKPGRLDPDEMEIMKRHPVDGREILLATRDVLDDVIDVAHGHHERLNGSGYPRALTGDSLSLYTKMVTIADVFDAITGDRVYSKGETAEKALSIIHKGSGHSFDTDLVIKFTENIGTYPLGTIVEMHNGEVGIVVENNATHRLRPKVKLLLDENQLRLDRIHTVDLGRPDRDMMERPYMIKRSHNPGTFGIDLSQHVNSYV